MSLRSLSLIAVFALSGCVVGQNIKLRYEPPAANAGSSTPVTLSVTDKREYVVSGNKRPEYVGHYRAGFGNTWDVVNFRNVPLADQMNTDVQKELQSLGFSSGNAQSGKTVSIEIHEWNFDAATNGRFWFDVRLVVKSANGAELYATQVKDERIIKGSAWSGAKNAMARGIPVIYGEVIRKLIRENPGTMAALRK
jgi:hypothetical protein